MDELVTEKMVTTTCGACRNVIDVTGLEPGDGIKCPYCEDRFPLTRQFGAFILERLLGTGGMGAVYLGRDTILNRVVAVKVLKPHLLSNERFMATFVREAEITASLNHPNIVQVYAFDQREGIPYLVMEYVPGGSLDDKIHDEGEITELEAIEIGLAVARGLDCALHRGLIHRDIKPGNILLNADKTAKVVDFGLSLSFDTIDYFAGEIWGTPYYVAPEKLERKTEDFRSDLYSLGATLFHAISGRPPYDGDNEKEIVKKHLQGKVVSLKNFMPEISDQTDYAVRKAMARNPEDRYETYAAFIEQLEDAKRRITDPDFHKKKKGVDLAILEASGTHHLWMIGGVVAVFLVIIGFVLFKFLVPAHPKTVTAPVEDITSYAPAAADGNSLLVNEGTGGGEYPAGTKVTITAKAPESGYQFAGWTGDTNALANPSAATTTLTKPDGATAVTATYVPSTNLYALTVTNGTGSGTYRAGTPVTVTANAPPSDNQFAGWTGNVSALTDPTSATTTLTMPVGPVTVTPGYAPAGESTQTVISVQFPFYYGDQVVSAMNSKNYSGGVVPVQNWNVANTDTGTSPTGNAHLIDATGKALPSSILVNSLRNNTAIHFTYSGYTTNDSSKNAAFPTPDPDQDGQNDASLAAGSNYNQDGAPETLTLTGLNPGHSYDLIVYVTTPWCANDGSTNASVTSGKTTYYINTSNKLGTWTQATSTTEDSPTTANYVKFSNLTGATSQTVTLTGATVGLAGFQLVDPGVAGGVAQTQ